MKRNFFVVAAVIFSSPLLAQDIPADSSITSMNEVVLTASKYPRKQSETGKVLTVINQQQIEKASGKSLGELLNTVVGVTIIGANNMTGTNLTTSIRGSSAGNVLILLDGIPVNDPSVNTNYFDLNFISLDHVERIEILKGGQSTLYGSDAVAGVINIISKKSANKKVVVDGNFSGGSYNTLKQALGLRGNTNKTDYSINYTHLSADGFSSAFDQNKTGLFDDDAYNQHAVSARLGFKLTNKLKWDFTGSWNKYKTDLDASAFTDERDYVARNDNKQFGSRITYDLGAATLHAGYTFNRAERRYLDDSTHKSSPFLTWSSSEFIGRTHFAELYANWKLSTVELLGGVDYRFNNTEQMYSSLGPFGPYSSFLKGQMNQLSPFASAVFKCKNGFYVETGGRMNIHSEYGSNFTFTVNPSLLTKKVKWFANLYSAFKAPTLYQLFDEFAGNPDLDAEKNFVIEAGGELLSINGFTARLVGHYTKTKNAILYTSDPNTFVSKYLNAAKQTTYGTELEAAYTINCANIKLNYAFTTGKTTAAFDGTGAPLSKDTAYSRLYRIPRHAVNLTGGFQINRVIYVSSLVRVVGKRNEYIYAAAPEILKGYATIDLYGEYKFTGVMKVFLDLKNITNKQYFEFLGYNARRFNFMMGVTFKI